MTKTKNQTLPKKLRDLLPKLHKKACEVRKNAHAPYSRFLVGAALADHAGNIHAGCNVENSSYGGTICAERSALFTMVGKGFTKFDLMVIVTDTPNGSTPCGLCRQVMTEFAPSLKTTWIAIANLQKITAIYNLDHLLPEQFDSKDLERF